MIASQHDASSRDGPDANYCDALPADALRSGEMRRVTIDGAERLLCRTSEGFHALDNQCPHAEQRLDEGRLRGLRVICPLHGAAFDVRDGRVLAGPARRAVAVYATRIVDGVVQIARGR